MSLADYLAKNYLTADSKPNKKAKKRKRKDDPQAGLVIADDDALGWNPAGDGNADDDGPITGKFSPTTSTCLQTAKSQLIPKFDSQ